MSFAFARPAHAINRGKVSRSGSRCLIKQNRCDFTLNYLTPVSLSRRPFGTHDKQSSTPSSRRALYGDGKFHHLGQSLVARDRNRGDDDRAELRVLFISADQLWCVLSVCPRSNFLRREFVYRTKEVVRLPRRARVNYAKHLSHPTPPSCRMQYKHMY